jgi:hypothetical protein
MLSYKPLKTRAFSGIERLGWMATRNFGLDFIRRPPMISVPSVPGAGFLGLPSLDTLAVPSGIPLPAQQSWCSGEVYFGWLK